jgi:hypothetical protein
MLMDSEAGFPLPAGEGQGEGVFFAHYNTPPSP